MIENVNCKILVCMHKECDIPEGSIYLPIHVGKASSNIDLGIQSDCENNSVSCDNISLLNPVYCEMTAMYWAWKNIRNLYPDIQYVGLCHYRRYFSAEKHYIYNGIKRIWKFTKSISHILIGQNTQLEIYEKVQKIESIKDTRFIHNTKRLERIIISSDMTTTYPIRIINSDVRTFFSVIGREYIELLEEIVNNDYPDYKDALHRTLQGSKLHSANMIIMKTYLLDDYCSFVFEILDKHISLCKCRGICFDPLEEKTYARVSGYLSEILTSIYVEKKINEQKVLYTEKLYFENS